MPSPNTLEDQALRLYRRYAVELVERFHLCPWAERTRLAGRTREHVFPQENSEILAPSVNQLVALAGLPDVDVALFIYPRLTLDLVGFEGFRRRLVAAYAERYQPSNPPFVMAAFHPQAPDHTPEARAVQENPELLIPYMRRTPDPTLQMVRYSLLEQARAGLPFEGTKFFDLDRFEPHAASSGLKAQGMSLRQRISQGNLETVERAGSAVFEAIFHDIQRDCAESYARLSKPDQ